jgi:hypothetical protein
MQKYSFISNKVYNFMRLLRLPHSGIPHNDINKNQLAEYWLSLRAPRIGAWQSQKIIMK